MHDEKARAGYSAAQTEPRFGPFLPAVASAGLLKNHEAKVQCEKQAKEQKLKGHDRSEFIKFCEAKVEAAAPASTTETKMESKKDDARHASSGSGMAAAVGGGAG